MAGAYYHYVILFGELHFDLFARPGPSLRSGFRLRTPASLTPANRLNLATRVSRADHCRVELFRELHLARPGAHIRWTPF